MVTPTSCRCRVREAARSVRRRADRRRGVGTRGGRMLNLTSSDGGRVPILRDTRFPPARRPRLLRASPTRRRQRTWQRWGRRPPSRVDPHDVPVNERRWPPHGQPGVAQIASPSPRGGGSGATTPGPGHSGARLDAVPDGQRVIATPPWCSVSPTTGRTAVPRLWRGQVEALGFDDELKQACSIRRVDAALDACRRSGWRPTSTRAPTPRSRRTSWRAGRMKTNVIPDVIDLDVDVRTLPGEDGDRRRRAFAGRARRRAGRRWR